MACTHGVRNACDRSLMRGASGVAVLRELGLFAGAGGGLLASRLLGWRTVCAVELEPYCQRVLAQRQRDGHLEPFPIWDDIRTFDGRPWRGRVDVVSGGFPCQDISSAGKRAGLGGEKSSLWFEMLRIIGEVRPAFVFAENSPELRTNGLVQVVGGLTSLGYKCAWGVLGAGDCGAPHTRRRLWIAAVVDDSPSGYGQARVVDAERVGPAPYVESHARHSVVGDCPVWSSSADVESGVADGVANRVDRIRATGNGQVPLVAATAWRVLSETLCHAQSTDIY